jgi:hypothetical protein
MAKPRLPTPTRIRPVLKQGQRSVQTQRKMV